MALKWWEDIRAHLAAKHFLDLSSVSSLSLKCIHVAALPIPIQTSQSMLFGDRRMKQLLSTSWLLTNQRLVMDWTSKHLFGLLLLHICNQSPQGVIESMVINARQSGEGYVPSSFHYAGFSCPLSVALIFIPSWIMPEESIWTELGWCKRLEYWYYNQ